MDSYWVSYVDMVEALLALIHASREMLHLAVIRNIILRTFAYDKLNDAKYFSVYFR